MKLRKIQPKDTEDLWLWRNHPDSRPMFQHTDEIKWEDHLQFLAKHFEEGVDHWFVAENDNGTPVGSVALYAPNEERDSWEWGRILIDPDERKQGYGLQMLRLLIDWCLDHGIVHLRSVVYAGNAASLKLHGHLGFRTVAFPGQWEDGRHFVKLEREL